METYFSSQPEGGFAMETYFSRQSDIEDTNLVGNINYHGILSTKDAREFLNKLEALMREHEITRLDVGWNPFRLTPGAVGLESMGN